MKSFKCSFFYLVTAVFATGCSPKIYVIDRQTVLEEEAAGEWPQFEAEILKKSEAATPLPFQKTQTGADEERLYNILNGEFVSSQNSKSAAKTH